MRKIIYLVVCCVTILSFASCKCNRTTEVLTPALAAKECAECLIDGRYEQFVEAIVFEKPSELTAITPEKRKSANVANAKALKAIHHESVQEKGGLKDVAIISETIAADGKTADVILAGTYNNGEIETITYKMVNDAETWKIRVNDNKEVWKAVTKEGDREVVKLRNNDHRDFVKVTDGEHRHIVKEIDGKNRDVEKIMIDGNREIHIDRTTPDGEVIKVIENGEETYAVKTKSTERRSVVKEMVEGEKDFVKVIEKRDGQLEVIKTLNDGERHREVLNSIDGSREIEKLKEDGEKIIETIKDKADSEVAKVKEGVDSEINRAKETIQK